MRERHASEAGAEATDDGPWHHALRAEAWPPRTRCHRLPARLVRPLTACDGARGLPALAAVAELPEPTAAHPPRTRRAPAAHPPRAMVDKGLITWDAPGHGGAG